MAPVGHGVVELAPSQLSERQRLYSWLASVRDDPLAFTMGAYPWGAQGTVLEKFDGPDEWSRWLFERVKRGLVTPHEAIQIAVASGHGVGKSATVAWIILWAFTTFPDTRGVVTANTENQLRTKTWAELGKWFNLCFFAREMFTLNATSLVSKDPMRSATWRVDMVPWSDKNTEAFQGLHNEGKRLLLIMDEASAIPDLIHEVAEGAMTDANAQIIWLMFGNPTRNSGRFKEAFGSGRFAEYWQSRQIDSRSVKVTNKIRIDRWIKTYGLDSDFVRVRVLGQFPKTGDMEFFSATAIDEAMNVEKEVFIDASTPLALGVDVARFGANHSVLYLRKGRDARHLTKQVFSGLSTVELSNHVFDCWQRYRPDGIFIDEGGVGGGVVDNCRAKSLYVQGVMFGGKDLITGVMNNNAGERYANMRAAMYGALRAWLPSGILPLDADLRAAMLAIRYTIKETTGEILLISKDDLLDENPELDLDTLDALALTFGGPLAPHDAAGGEHRIELVKWDYDPYSVKSIYNEEAA